MLYLNVLIIFSFIILILVINNLNSKNKSFVTEVPTKDRFGIKQEIF